MREGYKVEAYRLYTGHAVPVVMKEEGDEEKKYMKIENPQIIIICDKCLKDEKVIEALEKFEVPPDA